jgi:hypothetical protein
MAHIFKFPNESGGFDGPRNQFVMPQNDTSYLYLVAGQGLAVDVEPKNIVEVAAGSGDEKSAHGKAGLSEWENNQNIRKIILKSKSETGHVKLFAKDSGGFDLIKPLDVYVVDDKDARRVGEKGKIEPEMKVELEQLKLREVVLRIAYDQISSRVKSNAQGISLYHLPKGETLWCGAFAYWCWEQAALVKHVDNPFGSSQDALLSPQKAIHYAMTNPTKGVLLQYKGPNPMTMKGEPQELREIGWMGNNVEPGDIALWRATHAMDFKHVSFVESVDGKTFVDINGNAYDAGSGSALARISHDDINRKLPDGSYKCFFLHVKV